MPPKGAALGREAASWQNDNKQGEKKKKKTGQRVSFIFEGEEEKRERKKN